MKVIFRVSALLCFFAVHAYCVSNAKITVTRSQLVSFLETAEAGPDAKLVFCAGGKIHLVDFANDSLIIEDLMNADSGVLPVISPDGKYYTFAKGVLGDDLDKRNGRVYISELNASGTPLLVADPGYVPRFIQNSSVPEVLYSTCMSHPDPSKKPYDGCGAVVKRPWMDGLIGNPDTIWSGGSYYGGLSWDNRYLGTAWPGTGNAYMLDLEADTKVPVLTYLTLKNTLTKKDTMVAIKACNPSISSSRIFTDAIMLVDFSSGIVPAGYSSPLLPLSWDTHEVICICNYKRELLKCIRQKFTPELSWDAFDALPSEDAKGQSINSTWNYPEWSNHPYLAVATVDVERTWRDQLRGDVQGEKIYLINLKDETALPLISIADSSRNANVNLKWPWFWTSIPKDFSEQPGWLSTGLQSKPAKHIKKRGLLVNLRGNKINSNVPIEQVVISDLSGRCLWKAHFTILVRELSVPKQFISGGVFIIQLKSNGYPLIRIKSIKIE